MVAWGKVKNPGIRHEGREAVLPFAGKNPFAGALEKHLMPVFSDLLQVDDLDGLVIGSELSVRTTMASPDISHSFVARVRRVPPGFVETVVRRSRCVNTLQSGGAAFRSILVVLFVLAAVTLKQAVA